MRRKFGETEIVNFIKAQSRSPKSPCGIGDDAALLKTSPRQVITTDFVIEGVDFKKGEDLKRVGRKVLGINLSDLAAMGARPVSALLYAAFPKRAGLKQWKRFLAGWDELARKYKVSLIGGDLSHSKELMAGAVLIGEVKKGKTFQRTGAKAGDLLYVTGTLGGSIFGKHLKFEPRVKESVFLSGAFPVSSCIDLSDGLGVDLPRLLRASRKGVKLRLDRVPISQSAKKMSKLTGKTVLEHALQDGEDFELLFTVSPKCEKRLIQMWKRKFKTPLTLIGKITPGRQVTDEAGRKLPGHLLKGFDHFK